MSIWQRCLCGSYERRARTRLQRRVSLDVLGTFEHGKVGEAQLVGRLDQAHPVAPHLQQHFTDPHRGRVLTHGHLQNTQTNRSQITHTENSRTGLCSPHELELK